jgi:hypothetical protein
MLARIVSVSMPSMRALAWASSVWIGNCQPSHERLFAPIA